MMRRYGWLLVALALFAAWQWWRQAPPPIPEATPPVATPDARAPQSREAALPREAYDTLQRIHAGGPFAHRQDGSVFQNRERELPRRERGYYREYTVETPGSRDRGARRIVTGGQPPSEYWYTEDHYRSFHRIDGTAGRVQ